MTTSFPVHTVETAPRESQPLLQRLEGTIGMIPNLAASMAESPQLLEGFLKVREVFEGGTFTPAEGQALALTNAFENGCQYCMALHSAFAAKVGVPAQAIQALRAGRDPADSRLAALCGFSRRLVKERGRVDDRDLAQLLGAGYTRAQALEVVLGVALSVLPNFAHHITGCAVDEAFAAQSWTDPRR